MHSVGSIRGERAESAGHVSVPHTRRADAEVIGFGMRLWGFRTGGNSKSNRGKQQEGGFLGLKCRAVSPLDAFPPPGQGKGQKFWDFLHDQASRYFSVPAD